MSPRLLAKAESPIIVIRRAAATAKINVQKLRGNVSVLEGSGGNIAVLTGGNGKLLVDAGITASRPRITEALENLSADAVLHPLHLEHLAWRNAFDLNQDDIAITRRRLFDRAAADNAMVLAYHFPFRTLGASKKR